MYSNNLSFYTNIFILHTINIKLMTNQEQISIERKIIQKELTQKIKDLEKRIKSIRTLKIY